MIDDIVQERNDVQEKWYCARCLAEKCQVKACENVAEWEGWTNHTLDHQRHRLTMIRKARVCEQHKSLLGVKHE